MEKIVAYILIALGFLGGAFTSSLDATAMDWPYYAGAMAIGAVGVLILKRSLKRGSQAEHVLEGDRITLESSLANILMNLEELNSSKADIPTYEMRFEIDRLFRIDLMAFVDARDSMKHLYSLQDFADVMSHFAAGERHINRVWSASADGYVDEVLEYVGRAEVRFVEAKAALDAAQSRHNTAQAQSGVFA